MERQISRRVGRARWENADRETRTPAGVTQCPPSVAKNGCSDEPFGSPPCPLEADLTLAGARPFRILEGP
jgi:hypothetical protein